jgi:glycosyltransferase involved in cell wall biosynthesis
MRILSADAPYGQGGIGQHFKQLIEETRAEKRLHRYLSPVVPEDDPAAQRLSRAWWEPVLLDYTPIRWSNAWRSFLATEFHDRRMAALLPELTQETPVTHVMGFVGSSLHTFRVAGSLNGVRRELVAANSHVANVRRLHARASADTGIRDTWLNDTLYQKTLREYEVADRIYVHSTYTRDSFLQTGIDERRLVDTTLHVDPRFQPPAERPKNDRFHVVYVGRVDATKGVPLLMAAYDRLPFPARLTIVGGWATRRMRQFVEPWLAERPHVRLAPGDPLPVLQQADVFVHPSYEDGFGYAPMEALACGVPVIVTADTGMKEYVSEGQNGYVVPTGSTGAIVDALRTVYRTPLASTASLLASSTPSPALSPLN